MKKRKIIIISLVIALVIILVLLSLSLLKKEKKDTFDYNVVSTITLDINPSIRIELNKNEEIVSIKALNDDALNIIDFDYKGKSVEESLKNIIKNISDKEYISDNLSIILDVRGEIKNDEIKALLNNILTNENITYNVIIPSITENSSSIAKEYNISEGKASYIEEIISKYPELKIEEIKDLSINDINNKPSLIDEERRKEEDQPKEEDNTSKPSSTNDSSSSGGGYGSLKKCDNVKMTLTNEEAGKKAASLKGASVGTNSYCDILPPESYITLTSDGTCAYKVSFKYRTQKCIYYISLETGEVIGNPECYNTNINAGENQCIIMDDLGITKREQLYISNERDNGNEFVSDVQDVYGVPNENGERFIYEYHVSKSTGQITLKKQIGIVK